MTASTKGKPTVDEGRTTESHGLWGLRPDQSIVFVFRPEDGDCVERLDYAALTDAAKSGRIEVKTDLV